jgi:mannitol-1-phosphate/altronate dehydrogenase
MDQFDNSDLKDGVTRVGRQPLRKLGKGDRLLGPAHIAHAYGLPMDNLLKGIAAALLFKAEDDEESKELQKRVKSAGIQRVIAEIMGFEDGSQEQASILAAYHSLSRLRPLAKMAYNY